MLYRVPVLVLWNVGSMLVEPPCHATLVCGWALRFVESVFISSEKWLSLLRPAAVALRWAPLEMKLRGVRRGCSKKPLAGSARLPSCELHVRLKDTSRNDLLSQWFSWTLFPIIPATFQMYNWVEVGNIWTFMFDEGNNFSVAPTLLTGQLQRTKCHLEQCEIWATEVFLRT